MRLWQVGGREFPPLRTSTVITGNLPTPLDSFVGRTEELGVLSDLIEDASTGDRGRSRRDGQDPTGDRSLPPRAVDVAGGVWFVDLALAQSDSAVVEEVASLFGLQAAPGRSVEDRLIEYLEPRTAVLVFDNCEHVMRPAAGLIDRLLQACPTLKIVATSREALMLRGEHVMALGPLSMDDDSGDDAGDADAVALFVERLTAEGGPANIDDDDRAVVLEICRQLDGMPLAIELAAARARTLGVVGCVGATGGTSAAAVGWMANRCRTSTDVVGDVGLVVRAARRTRTGRVRPVGGVRRVVHARRRGRGRRRSRAGRARRARRGVRFGGQVDVHGRPAAATPTRYRYLETMRSYGRDHLSRSGMLADCRNRHAAHLAASARLVREALVGPDELEASRQAERLTADLRAALGWAVDQHLDDVIDAIAALAPVMAVEGLLRDERLVLRPARRPATIGHRCKQPRPPTRCTARETSPKPGASATGCSRSAATARPTPG